LPGGVDSHRSDRVLGTDLRKSGSITDEGFARLVPGSFNRRLDWQATAIEHVSG
jgi:hypothetical protein